MTDTLADELEQLAFLTASPAMLRKDGYAHTADVIDRLPAILLALRGDGKLREALAESDAALEICRQTITEQASARLDPTMPLITPDLLELLRADAEAQYACADNDDEGLSDRRQAHALSLLCDWQDAARQALAEPNT